MSVGKTSESHNICANQRPADLPTDQRVGRLRPAIEFESVAENPHEMADC